MQINQNPPNPLSPGSENDKPPFFKTWRGMYWLVLGALAGQIVVYYAITKYFE